MREVQAFEAKTHLRQLLDDVERRETVVITRHGRHIARILPEANRWRRKSTGRSRALRYCASAPGRSRSTGCCRPGTRGINTDVVCPRCLRSRWLGLRGRSASNRTPGAGAYPHRRGAGSEPVVVRGAQDPDRERAARTAGRNRYCGLPARAFPAGGDG
jgi:prevent-host-death family protein